MKNIRKIQNIIKIAREGLKPSLTKFLKYQKIYNVILILQEKNQVNFSLKNSINNDSAWGAEGQKGKFLNDYKIRKNGIFKTILGIIIFIFLFNFQNISANNSEMCSQTCSISEKTLPELDQFLRNSAKIRQSIFTSSIVSLAETGNSNPSNSYFNATANRLSNWSGMRIKSEYYSTYYFKNFPSAPIKRDEKRIQNEIDALAKALNTVYLSGKQNEIVGNNICNSIPNCNFSGQTNEKVLVSLLTNATKVQETFMKSLLGKNLQTTNILLTESDFTAKIKLAYNPNTSENCRSCAGENSLGSTIKNFKENMAKDFEEAKKDWNYAIKVFGKDFGYDAMSDEEYYKIKEDLLKKHISGQGFTPREQDILMENLRRYNSYSFGQNLTSNNFITNTLGSIGDEFNSLEISQRLANLTNDEYLMLNYFGSEQSTTIKTEKIAEMKKIVNLTNNIHTEVNYLYQSNLAMLGESANDYSSVQARLLNMHLMIIRAIGVLEKTIPFSEKTCNEQATGMGNCEGY